MLPKWGFLSQFSSSHPPVSRRIGPKNEHLALAFDLTGDPNRLGHHVEHLFVHRPAVIRQ